MRLIRKELPVCSISVKQTADEQLGHLCKSGKDGQKLEEKLFRFADEASVEQSSVLDGTDCHMHGMPDDLKDVRRKRFGRHRVFWTGQHTQCSFNVFYIKAFKKKGTEDEHDKAFKKKLAGTLSEPTIRELCAPDEV